MNDINADVRESNADTRGLKYLYLRPSALDLRESAFERRNEMTKVVIMLSLIFIPLVSFAQEKTEETKTKDMSVNVKQGDVKDENKVIIKGKIETIAEDGNFIIINATKLNTTKEFLEEAYLEVGDNVEIIAEKDGETLKVVDYRYIFEDELESSEGISEGIISTEEKSAEPSGQNVPQVQEPAKKEGTTK